MKIECPRIAKCKLFNGKILKHKSSFDIYTNVFCLTQRYYECKRFIVFEKVGACDDFVLPNSNYTIEEILEKMNVKN